MESVYQTNEAPQRKSPSRAKEIPEALRDLPQWMGTHLTPRKNDPTKTDKPPKRIRDGRKADKTDPANWVSFDEAYAALSRGEFDAIGYAFTKDDPFFVIDLDSVIDPETGELEPGAAEIIHAHGTYTELSCSRKGVHLIGVGQKPQWAECKTQTLGFEVEVYDRKRFVVLTGEQIGTAEVRECQGELENLCERLWPKDESPRQKPPNTGPVELEDAVLLERARTSRSGPRFHKLYDLGDTSGYVSPSEADYGLLNMLIFWTAGDRDRVISLFEASALCRQRGKHRNYVALSTDNALASYSGAFYKVRLTKEVREEEEQDPLAPYLELMLDPSAWTGRRGASAYKVFTAAVIRAAEDGIIDDEGGLRIGCDVRTLAEAAGTSFQTVSASALPYLMQEMKVLKWKRGKGTKAGVLVLSPGTPGGEGRTGLNTKVATHFSVQSSAPPKNAIDTLRLLIRMRYGYSASDTLLKLGMPAMFVAVALASSNHPARGYTADELAERTGRRKRDLRAPDGPLKRLKAAAVVQETRDGYYRFTAEFQANYERALEHSGVTYAEREQRRRHAEDREARNAELKPSKRTSRLRGKEQMSRLLKKKQEEARRRGKAEGKTEARKKSQDTPGPGEVRRHIDRLIREGFSEWAARRTVLVPDHLLECRCEVCG